MIKRILLAATCCMAGALVAAPASQAVGTYNYTDACIADASWHINPGQAPGQTGSASVDFWNADCTKAHAGANTNAQYIHNVWTEFGWGKHEEFDFVSNGVGCSGELISRQNDAGVGTVVSDPTGQIQVVTLERASEDGSWTSDPGASPSGSSEKFVPVVGSSQACGNAHMRVAWRGNYTAVVADGLSGGVPPQGIGDALASGSHKLYGEFGDPMVRSYGGTGLALSALVEPIYASSQSEDVSHVRAYRYGIAFNVPCPPGSGGGWNLYRRWGAIDPENLELSTAAAGSASGGVVANIEFSGSAELEEGSCTRPFGAEYDSVPFHLRVELVGATPYYFGPANPNAAYNKFVAGFWSPDLSEAQFSWGAGDATAGGYAGGPQFSYWMSRGGSDIWSRMELGL